MRKEKDIIEELSEIRRAFNDYFVAKNPLMMLSDPHWRPPMDVFDLPKETLVRLEIAGMDPKDIQIDVEGNQMIIRGRRHDHHGESLPAGCCRQMEIKYTNFRREVLMTRPFDADSIKASYNSGFLEIRIPVREQSTRKTKVRIRTEEPQVQPQSSDKQEDGKALNE